MTHMRLESLKEMESVIGQLPNPWSRVSSREVYTNPWLRLREDAVIRPDGSQGTYSVLELPESVGVLAINDDDEVAMVLQWRYVHGFASLEIPTGGFEPGETAEEAATRELQEETGLKGATAESIAMIQNSNGATTDLAHIVVVSGLTAGTGSQQPYEETTLYWVPFKLIVKAIHEGIVTESTSVASILIAQDRRRQVT